MEGAAAGEVRYRLDIARERGCTMVPPNAIRTAAFNDNGECRIAIENIHNSIAFAIISNSAILVANINTAADPNHANRMVELLDVYNNQIMGELDRLFGQVRDRVGHEHTFALVVYPRGTPPPFHYGNKVIAPAATPEFLDAILTYIDQRTGLRNQVTFGSFDVYPDDGPPQLVYTPLRGPGLGVLHLHGPKLVSPAKGALVIEREGGRTQAHLEERKILDHPVN